MVAIFTKYVDTWCMGRPYLVTNTSNLRINITESALNFSESSLVSSTRRTNARDIYLDHFDILHYAYTIHNYAYHTIVYCTNISDDKC